MLHAGILMMLVTLKRSQVFYAGILLILVSDKSRVYYDGFSLRILVTHKTSSFSCWNINDPRTNKIEYSSPNTQLHVFVSQKKWTNTSSWFFKKYDRKIDLTF